MVQRSSTITVYTWGYSGQSMRSLQIHQQQFNALIVDTRYVPFTRRR